MEFMQTLWPLSKRLDSELFHSARDKILRRFTVGAAIFFSVIFANILFFTDFPLTRMIVWFSAIIILWLCVFMRNVDYITGAAMFFLAVYMIGAIEFLTSTSAIRGTIILIVFPFFITALVGIRSGALSFIVSIIIFSLHNTISLPFVTPAAVEFPDLLKRAQIVSFFFLSLAAMYLLSQFRGIINEMIAHKILLAQELVENKNILSNRIASRKAFIRRSTELNQQISNILDEPQLAQRCVSGILATRHFANCEIYFLQSQSREQSIWPTYSIHSGANGPQKPILVADYPYRDALEELNTIILKPIIEEEVLANPDDEHLDNGNGDDSNVEIRPKGNYQFQAILPIHIGQERMGLLVVSRNEGNIFSNDELFFLETVASQVAISLRNARIYSRATRLAQNEQFVQTMVEKLQDVNSIKETLELTASQLGNHLGTNVNISLGSFKGALEK